MQKKLTILLPVLVLTAIMGGCGTRIDSMQQTLEYAVLGQPDVTLTAEEIAEQPYPLQYLTLGEQSRISLALGFDDKGLYKWLSGSQEVMVTRDGRIIQTQGVSVENVENDLEWVSNLDHDPLTCITAGKYNCPTRWSARVQVGNSVNASVQQINTEFSADGTETLTAPDGTELTTQRWQELVTNGDDQWINWYWVEQQTHRVVKSKQRLSSAFPVAIVEEVKPYSKDLKGAGDMK